jgi:hypothetical protein
MTAFAEGGAAVVLDTRRDAPKNNINQLQEP